MFYQKMTTVYKGIDGHKNATFEYSGPTHIIGESTDIVLFILLAEKQDNASSRQTYLDRSVSDHLGFDVTHVFREVICIKCNLVQHSGNIFSVI